MNNLQMVDTTDAPSATEDALAVYWRRKFDELSADSTARTISSLRSELRTIKRLAQEEADTEETMKSIVFHANLGLEISR